MRVPRRITEILNRKQEYIDLQRGRLEKSIMRLQSKLLDDILSEIIPQLDVIGGVIQDTVKNYRLLSALDKVYNDFTRYSANLLSAQFASGFAGTARLGREYFSVTLTGDLPARFEKVATAVLNKINLRVGINIEGDKFVRGGFLESILKDSNVGTQIKNYVSKSVTAQIDMKDFISGLKNVIEGPEGKTGIMEKQYERFAYDLYQQYDAAYADGIAQEFDMRYFLYQGGLIRDSRDFCAAHNGKVWSREEASQWPEWTPSKGDYPAGYEIKAKDLYSVPSYMSYPGYDPLVDRGGYNCRHAIGWISDELAWRLRPELREGIDK